MFGQQRTDLALEESEVRRLVGGVRWKSACQQQHGPAGTEARNSHAGALIDPFGAVVRMVRARAAGVSAKTVFLCVG
jgi:hypothetical protein